LEVPDYNLPEAAIAQAPAEPRDAARLLVAVDPGRAPEHRRVADLPSLLGPGDVLVVNTTRVLPARLRLRKPTGGAAEVLLLEPDGAAGGDVWEALVHPGRRLRPGELLCAPAAGAPAGAGGHPLVEVGDYLADGRRRVRLLRTAEEVMSVAGSLPLPPYIRQPLRDPERYQTVYAENPGSVAAPTAGLHLTADVLRRCRSAGARVEGVDLSVGLATFRPITAARAEDHVMQIESYRVPDATMAACGDAERVVAVGTTTVRALETAAATGELSGRSDLYIHGDFKFGVVDVLMTNFHQPRSSLLVLLEAFCGSRWRELYVEALAAGYRFLSFGDAMFVSRKPSQ
jgi:S-adenosylmethionine:tRNA ribosyltransferase-isomerase